ncbi:EAL domain-containing protein [Thiomicrospira microaerophila]|uniref:EAL domain-containing protein n=1 Tax=Thiomicrospira microaerophila TaxID=406020 RepID=UPI000696AFC8|nr:EAL domain-containing protein [Thiomicrospira microaerophila]
MVMTTWFKRFGLVLAVLLLNVSAQAQAQAAMSEAGMREAARVDPPVYRLAVLAFRDKASTFARWAPLADYLSSALKDAQFELAVFHNDEMEQVVAKGGVDFVLTQPAQYVLLTYRHQLSSPLASLLNKEGGVLTDHFGGVIFTASHRDDIASLRDVKGKTVAGASLTGLGAYQMQAFELLQQGVRLPQDARVVITGQPQRNAVEAVLRGDADVGFVRTGVLEGLVERGLLDMSQLKLLNARRVPSFPFVTSTQLYPEWAFAAMPNVDKELTRLVAAALLSMPREGEVASSMSIAGFSVAGDYRTIDLLLRELRLEPFDDFELSAKELIHWWFTEILIGLLVFLMMVVAVIYVLLLRQKQLTRERNRLHLALEEVRLLKQAVEQSPEAIVITDTQGQVSYLNPMFEQTTGYRADEVLGKNPRLLRSGETPEAVYNALWARLRAGEVWRGELSNRRKNGEIYPSQAIISPVKDVDGNVTHFLAIQRDISARKQREQRIEDLLYRDQVTGLANRNKLIEVMDSRLHSLDWQWDKAALVLLNISRFKFVNQLHGVDMGDAILRAVAGRLNQTLNKQGLVARLAADQFALFLEDDNPMLEQADWLKMMGEKTLKQFDQAFEIKGELFYLEVCVGVAALSSDDAYTTRVGLINEVFNQAGMALKAARTQNTQGLCVFSQSMLQRYLENHQLKRALEQGIKQDALRLFVQPQVNQQQKLVGLECLVRWQHPELGLLPPGRFIELAEASNLIVALGDWVLREACKVLAKVQQRDPSLRLAVNTSPRHFRQKDFVDKCKTFLAEAGANPKGLMLEITESLFLDDFEDVVEKMKALKAYGVRFSIDDFGTGYSSLSYLQHLPVDEVKIDRAFILAMDEAGIAHSLVPTIYAMAQQMNLQVVAEGIETEEQRIQLAQFNKMEMQGFLFAKPQDNQAWLESWKTARD